MSFKINDRVFIKTKTIYKKGVIKDLIAEEKKYKVTYFDEDSARHTDWFDADDLEKHYKPLQIKILYHDPDMPKLEKIDKGDLIDLYNAEKVVLQKGDFTLIDLGISLELPRGYKGVIVPRSSTFKKWGILQVNSPGQCDNSYRGNNDKYMMAVFATRDTVIEKYSRICQFEIQRVMPKVNFVEVDDLENSCRGGFGSTGVK